MHVAYGKINVDKKVELSKAKAQQFEKEAEQEIKDSDKLQMEKKQKKKVPVIQISIKKSMRKNSVIKRRKSINPKQRHIK